jgi:hypothetical protein
VQVSVAVSQTDAGLMTVQIGNDEQPIIRQMPLTQVEKPSLQAPLTQG